MDTPSAGAVLQVIAIVLGWEGYKSVQRFTVSHWNSGPSPDERELLRQEGKVCHRCNRVLWTGVVYLHQLEDELRHYHDRCWLGIKRIARKRLHQLGPVYKGRMEKGKWVEK